MLDDVLEATQRHAVALGMWPVVAVHPADALAEVADRAPAGTPIIAQRGAGLGSRMDHAVRQAAGDPLGQHEQAALVPFHGGVAQPAQVEALYDQ